MEEWYSLKKWFILYTTLRKLEMLKWLLPLSDGCASFFTIPFPHPPLKRNWFWARVLENCSCRWCGITWLELWEWDVVQYFTTDHLFIQDLKPFGHCHLYTRSQSSGSLLGSFKRSKRQNTYRRKNTIWSVFNRFSWRGVYWNRVCTIGWEITLETKFGLIMELEVNNLSLSLSLSIPSFELHWRVSCCPTNRNRRSFSLPFFPYNSSHAKTDKETNERNPSNRSVVSLLELRNPFLSTTEKSPWSLSEWTYKRGTMMGIQ